MIIIIIFPNNFGLSLQYVGKFGLAPSVTFTLLYAGGTSFYSMLYFSKAVFKWLEHIVFGGINVGHEAGVSVLRCILNSAACRI